jgi:cysteinyl-tRNA synthetase
MSLKLFNTLTRSVTEFKPLDPSGKEVRMYCCGPTVYDFGHVGNFRTFVFADLARRTLEFNGYTVVHVMNITDVEDKIIKRVRETSSTLRDYTAQYEQAFLEDMRTLRCLPPHHMPRATDHVAEIIELIGKLLERGIAYKAADGIYFSIVKYQAAGHRYGQLVNLNFEQMRPGARVASDEYSKESVADFALWKSRTPEDGNVFWPSPWGEGRPGWHIECSAMSMKYLGRTFDLHLGGEDLVFPHHEDEIAQSEGADNSGQPFVKHWLHGAHLLVEGKKMAKSLGNFFTLRDLLKKGYNGREIRYLLLSGHYRETFNFTMEGLNGARQSVARIDECLSRLREVAATPRNADTPVRSAPGSAGILPAPSADPTVLEKFTAALNDDLNVSAGWGVVFDWVRDLNRALAANEMSPEKAASALATWERIDSIFGLGGPTETTDIPAEIQALLEAREAARKARDFKRADEVRAELRTKGWVIEDTPKGPRLKKD